MPRNANNRGGVASETSTQQLSAAEQLRKAVQLRRAGATFSQIAQEGIYSSAQAAHRAVKNYYKKLHGQIGQDVEELRAIDLDRIDALLRSLWPIATNNAHDRHLYAVDRVVKLLAQRADLLGLKAPQRHELTGESGERLMPQGVDLSNLDPDQLEQVRAILEASFNGGGSPASS